ncbi:MAG TPA: CusA/CzcA family heavy metal efflux RND transporter, partial [Alphaproteobacteria bacterium]
MNSVVAFALKNRFLVILAFLGMIGAGLFAFAQLNIEAYPDPVPPMVDIITQSPGQSAEEIERYITIPIEVGVSALPYLTSIRTISLFGLSDVKLQFTYDFTYLQAEQQVLNRLGQISQLPNGAQPTISPTSPIGEIYRYRLVGPGYSLTELKTLQDWVLQRRFRAVPGVIDVTGWGGRTKTYEITVDLNRLIAYGVTLPQMLQTLGNANINVGGGTVNIGPQAAVVRGVGLVQSVADIENTMLSSVNGTPVRVLDVATVQVSNLPRRGIAGQDNDDDIVEGIVLMRRGQESLPTIQRVEAEVETIAHSNILPPGVRIEHIYDRAELIGVTTRTVLHNLLFGVILIFLVQWLFLGNIRSAIIVSATIPFAFLFAASIMVARGESANLLSIGAIDFGLIVDATVIMVENIYRHLSESHGPLDAPPALGTSMTGLTGKLATILGAASEVNRSIFFAASIIIAGFVPLFGMTGVEGHIFGPMSKTYAYALTGGLIATFTVSPVLAAIFLPDQTSEVETAIVRWARRAYRPLLAYALRHRKRTLAAAGVLLAIAVFAGSRLGLEFLPKLEEGNLWIRATLPSTISLEEGNSYVNEMRKLIKSYPEMVTVISQHGRPDDGTDATGFFNAEFFVPLKPASEWPRGVDKPTLTRQVSAALEDKFPGVEFNFSQYIQDNVEESVSGVKGENSVKVFGQNLEQIAKAAKKIESVLESVPGVADVAIFTSLGQPTIAIDINRAAAARYALSPGDINATVQAAIGGQSAGDLYEQGSDRHFPMVVRLAPEYRQSLDAIQRITVGAQGPNGTVTQIPLTEVANVRLVSGAAFIYREQQQRYIPIKFSVVGRDLGSTVLDAQRRVAKEIQLLPGQRLEWVGEFANLTSAVQRLAILVPLCILLICLLLYVNFSSAVDMALAVSVIPMAMIGGILSLVISGTAFSISAAIGFVALFGISVMDGIIVLSSFNQLIESGASRGEAILEACHTQFRPVLMTCVAACVGLVPAALSSGIGSQVQKPLAMVVVGGISLAPFLILLVLPVLIVLFSRRGHAPE